MPTAERPAAYRPLGAAQAAAELAAGAVTAVELVERALDAVAAFDSQLNAFITVDAEGAVEQAAASDARRRAGTGRGPLDGVIVAVKDVIHVAGLPTTAGSRTRQAAGAEARDAATVARLRAAGAVIIGKTHTHEFALGGTGENEFFGNAHNPYRRGHISGGSSSGSAVAVAAGMAHAALGSDTGGSIRSPAALCGVVGMKPTIHSLSLEGALPSGWTLDSLGWLTPRVADTALLHRLFEPRRVRPWERPRVGVAGRYFAELLSGPVEELWGRALERLREAGFELVELEGWPDAELVTAADAVSWTINSAEAAAFHEETLEREPDSLGGDIRERLELGRALTATEYLRAQRLRRYVQEQLDPVWERVDALITPANVTTAFPHGTTELQLAGRNVPAAGSLGRSFRIANLTGWPALSVPSGMARDGLPAGVQLMAGRGADLPLLALAGEVEALLRSP